MNDNYVHYTPHDYSPFVDEYGVSIPPCRCGEQPIPGGRECPSCLMARCQAPGFVPSLPERRSFPSRPVVDPPVISSKENAK